eukprot:TRINITY_DN1223_c0_g1_i1.p1 TRINITY_DN1223_c0_g1~~TRINITY_DN1223_c0_g1_i1.p1  ORF type:complete len:842 (+),score=128.13 TRINITY_DN1223_c0_g1_i1:33-2528(+)
MASCELDYRLPANDSESMDYEDTDSDDDNKLQIVESPQACATLIPRTLMRSLSAGESMMMSDSNMDFPSGANNASDAVESLLLLGQRPVFTLQESQGVKIDGNEVLNGSFPKFSNQVEQRMMVNYYQKMRERNNEASKRCRLKRRIKQDSLEKTRMMLESHREALGHRVAKLHKIKQILSDACRCIGKDDKGCECLDYCAMIKAANREMPDLLDLSNYRLIKKSKLARDTNLEEILGAQAQEFSDLRPLKRGPRKQDLDTGFTINSEAQLIKAESPVGALDLSAGNKLVQNNSNGLNLIKVNNTGIKLEPVAEPKEPKFMPVTFLPKTYIPLAPKSTPIQIPPRKVIMDNPNICLPQTVIPLLGSNTCTISSPNFIENSNNSTISLHGNFNGTNTIILTPLGNTSLPSTIFNLPLPMLSTAVLTPEKTMSSTTMMEVVSKAEPDIVIKSEPDISIVEIDTELETTEREVKTENVEMSVDKDPTVSCAAVLSGKESALCCSKELLDLNSLTQTLDLVNLEPKMAGELTAAEKYIIKSRLEIEFWKAEESASFICSSHRHKIVHNSNMQSCSVCCKKKSKKLDMYFITYRMAVEFYMTNGRFLAIGLLACSNCKIKSLKGLDFSNSYILPESGHPLNPLPSLPSPVLEAEQQIKREPDERVDMLQGKRLLLRESPVHREVVLPPINANQGKLATIQPLPPRPQAKVLASARPVTPTLNPLPQTPPFTPIAQASSADVATAAQKYQKLNESLAAFNPTYKPLGFTINSLSSCSESVLKDALLATRTAVSTILSTIAPGQEASLWKYMRPEMDKVYVERGSQASVAQASCKNVDD